VEISGCVFYPVTGDFLVIRIGILHSISVDGQTLTVIGDIGQPNIIRGFALVEGSNRLFGVTNDRDQLSTGKLLELNPDTGATISGPTQIRTNESLPVKCFGMDWDPLTEEIYLIYSRPEDAPTVRTIGRLNVTSAIVTEGCVAGTHAINTMAFDASGRLWLNTGKKGPDRNAMFTMANAPIDL